MDEQLRYDWSPQYTIEQVLISIRRLLKHPNLEQALEPEIASVCVRDKPKFEQAVRDHTRKHALAPPRFSSDLPGALEQRLRGLATSRSTCLAINLEQSTPFPGGVTAVASLLLDGLSKNTTCIALLTHGPKLP